MTQVRIVLPTRNEQETIANTINDLVEAFKGYEYQILVIDDGDDQTAEIVNALNLRNWRIKVIARKGKAARNGLGGALLDGFNYPGLLPNDVVIMMDSDGQHPATAAVQLYEKIVKDNIDVAMGSRYIEGGSSGGLDGGYRLLVSTTFRMIPRVVFAGRMFHMTDPLGGLLAFRKRVLPPDLDCSSWKVAMEILLKGDYSSYAEIPYIFQERSAGESKASMKQGLKFLKHVWCLAKSYYF